MVVKYRRDEKNRENETGRDAPPELEPHGIKGDFLAQPLSLHIPPKEIVRQDRQQRTEHEFKHGSSPCSLRSDLWPPVAMQSWGRSVLRRHRPRAVQPGLQRLRA